MAKQQHNDAEPSNGLTAVQEIVNGSTSKKRKTKEYTTEKKQTKEERREHKRLKHLAKENEVPTPSSAAALEEDSATSGYVETAAKAPRKPERARRKALKRDVPNGTNGSMQANGHIFAAEEGSVEPLDKQPEADIAGLKADRKAEKARLKAVQKAKKLEKGTATNGHAAQSQSFTHYEEDPDLTALPQSEIESFLSSNFITITDSTASRTLRPIICFSHLPASALTKPSPFKSFKNPTPIQSAAWPFLLSGRDVIGVAETGSGKTLAFGVPCIRHISSLSLSSGKGSVARAVIVSPTRELAVQIHDQLLQLATPAGLNTVCVYGGVPKDAQRLALKKAHIVVATPGRLNDLINEGAADLSNVGYVVLDEADRMLDKGFEEEIRKIISTTRSPSFEAGRQTLMFTATWPLSVRELASTFMRSPVKIAIGDNPTGELRANARIVQRVEVVDPRSKEMRLLQLIKTHQSGKSRDDRILVFCLYKKEATRVEMFLRNKGLRVAGIHGDLSQEKRTASLEAFKKEGGTPLLVATDVAARGLDIPAVKVVINVTFPLTVEDYVHRIGR